MAGGDTHAIEFWVRRYTIVLVALLILTIVTVGASYLNLSWPATIGLALFIATVKGGLVCCYFMHLISERKLIYWILLLTLIFFIVLMFLPTFGELNIVTNK